MSFLLLNSKDKSVENFLFDLRLQALVAGANIVPYNKDDLSVTGHGRVMLDVTMNLDGRLHVKVGDDEFVFDGGLWNLDQIEACGDWVFLNNTTFIKQFPCDPTYLKYVFRRAK